MLSSAAVAALLLVTRQTTSLTDAEDRFNRVARIGYREVSFETPLDAALRFIPGIEFYESADSNEAGLLTLETREDSVADIVLLRYADAGLLEIQWVYLPATVASFGGSQAMTELALREYGRPTSETGDSLTWDFPGVNRTLVVRDADGGWMLQVLHRSRRLACEYYADVIIPPTDLRFHTGGVVPPTPNATGARAIRAKAYPVGGLNGALLGVVENPSLDGPSTEESLAARQRELSIIEAIQKAARRLEE